MDKLIQTVNGAIEIRENTIIYFSNDGKKSIVTIENKINTYVLIGEFPIYVVVGCENGNVYSIEFPGSKQILITHNELISVKNISSFPETHNYHTLIIDNNDAVIVYDHLYQKTIIYSPSLPSELNIVEYYYPLNVLLLLYNDGRSFVWSLDSGSLLSTLNYSVSSERIKSTIIYQSEKYIKRNLIY